MTTVKLVRAVRTRRRNFTRPKKTGIVRDRRIVTMKYHETYSPTITNIMNTQVYRANSIFDPAVAVGGHQPRGFDQFMALYTEWVVLSSTISVFTSCRTNKEVCAANVVVAEQGVANDATLVDMRENNSRTTRLGHWHPDGGKLGFIRAGVNVAKYMNRKGGLADDADLIGTETADCTKQIHYHINHINGGNLDVNASDVNVMITYRVMLLNPVKQVVS